MTVEIHSIPGLSDEENKSLARNFISFLKKNMGEKHLSYCSYAANEWMVWGEKRGSEWKTVSLSSRLWECTSIVKVR